MSICVSNDGACTEVIARADKIDEHFLNGLVDELSKVVLEPHCIKKILVEVISPKLEMDILKSIAVFKRAVEFKLHRAHIAYVVTGRPLDHLATFVENYTSNRGMSLRFFSRKPDALDWLRRFGDVQDCRRKARYAA